METDEGDLAKVVEALKRIDTYPEELGLDLTKPEGRFKWLLASILFAKRIPVEIAKRTFKRFMEKGLTSPKALLKAGWNKLVEVLDAGGYVRYDFSTASNLLEAMETLENLGGLEELYETSTSPVDLERRLMSLKGVGPTAVSIFLRELRGVWSKARPKLSSFALEVSRKLRLPEDLAVVLEPRLVKLFIEYCKRGRCPLCPVKNFCCEEVAKKSIGKRHG